MINWSLTCHAVCLDGSPPAYHFDKGFGKGINNWIVHIEVCSFQESGTNNISF